MKTATFLGRACEVHVKNYQNGQTALVLLDAETEELMTFATRAIDQDVPEGCVAIKDYSENEGLLDALVEADIVMPTGKTYPSGFTELIECRLLD